MVTVEHTSSEDKTSNGMCKEGSRDSLRDSAVLAVRTRSEVERAKKVKA